ncbi:MAG: ABC transporter ATP-binding protein [Flavipsychrobacter sp.]|nr:ABC transporter ATP-binding protein [Flavipsychrobacter sp.]
MSFLTVEHISKKHGGDFLLNDISFVVDEGKRLAIAGETGSGKTTLMQIVGGLEQADSGKVFFEGKRVWGLFEKMMPGHKNIAYLSQHYELPKKYRVSELLAYANNLTDEASAELYNVCRITHLTGRWSHTLSGGEKQRVALAKLLTETPKLLLLDEPYSNLDLIHKLQLKDVIWDVGERLGVTCMLISHDTDDMLPWANEIMVLKEGSIVQTGAPHQIYKQPRNDYVAGLFGKYNVVSPKLAASLSVPEDRTLYTRPEDFIISTELTNGVSALVTRVLYMGSHLQVDVVVQGETVTVNTTDKAIAKGMEVYLGTLLL